MLYPQCGPNTGLLWTSGHSSGWNFNFVRKCTNGVMDLLYTLNLCRYLQVA